MISRNYITCKTCGHAHILRIQIGHAEKQEHSFNCKGCKEPIKIGLDIDAANVRIEINTLENCDLTRQQEGTVLYLSSEFVASEDKIHDEMYFPSSELIRDLSSLPGGLGLFRELTADDEGKKKARSIESMWRSIQKVWRLSNSGNHEVARRLTSDLTSELNIKEGTISEILWSFMNGLFPPNEPLREERLNAYKKNSREFERFIHYYLVSLKPHHRRSQFEIISEYFDLFQQHSQVLIYVRHGIPLRERSHATSIEFDRVKGFYAKSYEFFSGAICLLTCINNILSGRKFDELQDIKLSKYLETDKAKRRNSISQNKSFYDFTSEFDSALRNASYHNWFFLKEDNSTIEYRSGGTGAINSLSYTEYLYRCGLMFKQICQLFSFEIELVMIGNEIARRTLSPTGS